MKSKWFELKNKAISLRRKGFPIGKIERELGVPRSTLSGWLKNIKLSEEQKEKILKDWKQSLVEARKKAVIWHNEQKFRRLEDAENAAKDILNKINFDNNIFFELALAFLYLGEGSKKNSETALGSSDYKILKFFLTGLKMIYKIDISKMRGELHLRADQDPEITKKYWAKVLGLPIENFTQVHIDPRTKGRPTYPHYKGVCNLRCGNVAIQRRLVYLANLYCEKVTP